MRYRPLLLTIATLAIAGFYGCGDDVTDPDALLESAEAEAVMASARALPMLPDVMARATARSSRERAALVRAGELWKAGVADDGGGGTRRRLAVGYALPIITASVSAEEWSAIREDADDWIATAEAMLRHLPMPDVAVRLEAARRHLIRADAPAATERQRAYYLLLAISELVETTPRYVARALVRSAETALAGAGVATEPGGAVTSDDPGLERAARLKDWAERAVAEGDYLLAIQRAYYAIQLAEGS